MEENKVIHFYDNFVAQQFKTGVNERIYGLYKRMLALGLNTNSIVLELGCGIGVNTFLMSKTVTNGCIEAVDLSPESVAFAQTKFKQSNITFTTHDVVTYLPQKTVYDFVLLFDVLEHIPMEQHAALFANIAKVVGPTTKLIINIPNPDIITHDKIHQPQVLQIIDQALPLSFILNNLNATKLRLVSLDTYSVWFTNDYQFLIIDKQQSYIETKIHQQRTFAQKLNNKLLRLKIKLFCTYK
jgi:trans-aconitate 2-methyltransferase